MPTVVTEARYTDGSYVVREEDMSNEALANLRAYEERLRSLKASTTRTGLPVIKYKSAAQQKQKQILAKSAKIKAQQQKEQEAIKIKREENMIRNLLSRGVRPHEVRQLLQTLNELDTNLMHWKYIDSLLHVTN